MARGALGTVSFRMSKLGEALGEDGLRAMTEAAAYEMKAAAMKRLVLTVGGDRRMSSFGSKKSRGRVKGGVGYDYEGHGVAEVKYRPGGFWALLEEGARKHQVGGGSRSASGKYRRGSQGARLVINGQVVTAPIPHPGTRPKKALSKAQATGEKNVPAAVERAVADLVTTLLEG